MSTDYAPIHNSITIPEGIWREVETLGEPMQPTLSLCIALGMTRIILEGEVLIPYVTGRGEKRPGIVTPRKTWKINPTVAEMLYQLRPQIPVLNDGKVVKLGLDTLRHYRAQGQPNDNLWQYCNATLNRYFGK